MKGAILYKPVLTNVGLVNKPPRSPSFAQFCKTRPFGTLQRALIPNRALVLPSANVWKVQSSVNLAQSVNSVFAFFHQEANKAGSKSHSCKNKELWDFQMCSLDQIPTVPARSRLRQLLLPHRNNKTHLFQQLGGRGRLAPLAPAQGSRSDFSY